MSRSLPALALVVAALALPTAAHAYSRGVSFTGCDGCHGDGTQSLTMTTTPAELSPGTRARTRLTVRGDGVVAGAFIQIDVGTVAVVGGGGLARTEGGLTHDGARTMSGGVAVFELDWTAPSTPGAVRFDVSNVVGNGNGRSSGDGAVQQPFDFVFGCAPATYYRDFDGDGYGRSTLPRVHCAGGAPEGYALTGDDCNDSDERAHPGADDVCNGRDDDCNGMVDDNAEPVTQYPDADGDGYYSADERMSGESYFGCDSMSGRWAAVGGDCRPMDPAINPGAEDVCNGLDDDCDFDVDERVRPQCGQGWCLRDSSTCRVEDCVPGQPRDELCNFFDDDCDGGVDEGSCPAGQVCGGYDMCVPEGSIPRDPDGGGTGGGGGGSASSSGGCGCAVAPRGTHALVTLLLGVGFVLLLGRRRS